MATRKVYKSIGKKTFIYENRKFRFILIYYGEDIEKLEIYDKIKNKKKIVCGFWNIVNFLNGFSEPKLNYLVLYPDFMLSDEAIFKSMGIMARILK